MIIVKNLSKKFGNVKVLDNINLKIKDGEFFCIVGPSGCGKTTLLRIIAGLEKPTSGEVYINSEKVGNHKSSCSMVFQQYALFPWRTVLENVMFPLEIQGISESKRRKIAEEYLKLVDLQDFKDAYPYELSGGMKQRVAIVRALVNDPKVLLMDEPFAALDMQTRNFLQKELSYIWEKTCKTIVFVTHNIDEAVFLGDRVAVMSARPGRILKIFEVDLKRPRDRLDEKFLEIRGKILDILEKEVKRSIEIKI